ncbi:MAG TPA: mechanosensitive ion channel [Chroococcidiopsis sp.]
MNQFLDTLGSQLGGFLPSLMGAIAILILGWFVATIVASVTRNVLKRTDIDSRLAPLFTGQTASGQTASPLPLANWIATAVYWIIMTFVLVAFLNALNLEVVSQPLNNFLQQIFSYLPKVGGAVVLLAIAWALATVSKLLVTRGLERFHLDEQLAQQTGNTSAESPFLLNETLGNALYWFIFLFFLPLILDALDLQGPLQPVQNLLDSILSVLPRLFTATIIGAVGWLIARIIRGIVTNLLATTGADRLGAKFGLSAESGAVSLSTLTGTVVYVLVLIPTAIAALNALAIEAISAPAVLMLEDIMRRIPQVLTAALVLVVFYVIGKFVAELVTNLLTSFGFNNVFTWLGLPSVPLIPATAPETAAPTDATDPVGGSPAPRGRTPSEIIGAIAWIAIILFGAVAASEVLQFAEITTIVRAILRISAQVLSGVVVFAVGLYLANLAFGLIASSGNRQARILGQSARIAIIALVGAMALQQMGVATNIVNLAFGLLLGAIAVAIALAFGLGGRDIAAEQIREWLSAFKQNP